MNSDAFARNLKLRKVWIGFNPCINANLEGDAKIATLSNLIRISCQSASENVQQFSEVSDVTKLELQLREANEQNSIINAEKLQCQSQVKMILDLQEKWEIRWDATFAAKTGELKDLLNQKKAEVVEKDAKIKQLENRIEAMNRVQAMINLQSSKWKIF